MNKTRVRLNGLKSQKGAVVVIVALATVALVGLVAVAVDVGHVMTTRNELQNVADAAALGAADQLGAIYVPMTFQQQLAYVCDPAPLIQTARNVALQNQAAGTNINVSNADVTVGQWNSGSRTFSATLNQPNAVRVTARRDSNINSPISTFFARIFGTDSVAVTATATAALTPPSKVPEGGLPCPFGISSAWFTANGCGNVITFFPTSSLAGWHTYDQNPNASTLRKTIDGLAAGTYQSPEAQAGQTYFNFTGGNVANAFNNLLALFNKMRVLNDGIIDGDNNPNTWTTTVPVFAAAPGQGNQNPTGSQLIVGFATVTITQVQTAPQMSILGTVICNKVINSPGGGSQFGPLGSVPGLVQ